ncbi:MAG: hypothetical protein ACXVB0_11615 [Mucilaginibacter sp.]
MKKILILLVFILFIFASCKKKNDVIPVNTITATIDGVNVNFNVNVLGRLVSTPQGAALSKTIVVQGSNAAQAPGKGIAVSLTSLDQNAIAKGTYTLASSKNNTPVWIQVIYENYDPFSDGPDQPYFSDSSGIQPTTITITSISSTNVQGTFSGTLVYSQGGTDTKTVTNGKFNVNIN